MPMTGMNAIASTQAIAEEGGRVAEIRTAATKTMIACASSRKNPTSGQSHWISMSEEGSGLGVGAGVMRGSAGG